MSKRSKKHYYVPTVLVHDLEETVKLNRPPKGLKIQRFIILLGILTFMQYSGIDYNSRKDKEGLAYYPLQASKMRSSDNCGKRFAEYRDYLEEHGFIQQHPHRNYLKGKYSRGFRLSDHGSALYQYSKWSSQGRELRHVPHYLMRWFNPKLKVPDTALESLLERVEDESRSFRIRMCTAMVNNGDYRLSRKNPKGRLYSVITMMPRELRSLLEYDGKRLAEIDIKTCQPYLLIKLIQEYYGTSIPPDAHEFIDLVISGEYYDHMAARNKSTRDDAKEATMFYFFSPVQAYRDKTERYFKSHFKMRFPSVYELVNYHNRESNKGPSGLCGKLTEIEAKLVLVDTGLTLGGLNPIFTVHDSCLIQRSDIDRATVLVKKAGLILTGYEPTIDLK